MKKNLGKYPEVKKLPPTAVTVKQYADGKGVSVPCIYKKIRENRADFKIVVFQDINFIIP